MSDRYLVKKEDTDIRVIDQRIGMGIGNLHTVIRLYHRPTGILIEIPQLTSRQQSDLNLGYTILRAALEYPDLDEQYKPDKETLDRIAGQGHDIQRRTQEGNQMNQDDLDTLTEVRQEIRRINQAAGQTVFNPAATQALDSILGDLS